MDFWPKILLVDDFSFWFTSSIVLLIFEIGNRFVIEYLDPIKNQLKKKLDEKKEKDNEKLNELHKYGDVNDRIPYLHKEMKKDENLSESLSKIETYLDIRFLWFSILSLIFSILLIFFIRVRSSFIIELVGTKEILYYYEPILYPLFLIFLSLGVLLFLLAYRRALNIIYQISLMFLRG